MSFGDALTLSKREAREVMFQETGSGERVEYVTRGPFDDSYAAEAIG
jgi:hypothetical protein